ncbi:CPBP family intramembrane glutamic endopeptidase [uncultured Pelagimonas sp.]|uniref:CPBP family intramembrane glutamic endopeptidase n=1 Tax=uncultured Pelagimonas sp. TaxID=1618102 RepID=UPI0026337D9B|nr:CPBP family intramembrane glutamic endopeptidase [uncultured Pelagimonas sp.]
MKYAPYERLVMPARPSAGLGRLAIGIIVIAFVHFALIQGVFAVLRALMSAEGYFDLVSSIQRADTATALLAVLILTGSMGLGAIVASEMVHGRSFASLIGPRMAMLRQFKLVLRPLAILLAISLLLLTLVGGRDLLPGVPFGTWMQLLPLTVLALLIQTGAEELVFRGYLQSQLAARFGNPAVWIFVPSLIFAVLHYQPEVYGENARFFVIWSFLFGVLAADLTARTGTLGPAIAIHFANNFTALALVSLKGDMSGLALWQLPYGPEAVAAIRAHMPGEFLFLVIYWLAARLALRV